MEESKDELKSRLNVAKENLLKGPQNNREVRRYGEKKTLDFSDTKQESNENNLSECSDIDEITKTKYNRTPVFEVRIDGNSV